MLSPFTLSYSSNSGSTKAFRTLIMQSKHNASDVILKTLALALTVVQALRLGLEGEKKVKNSGLYAFTRDRLPHFLKRPRCKRHPAEAVCKLRAL